MRKKIAIINYGMGNLHSVAHAFSYLGCETEIVSEPEKLHIFNAIVLPGVGAFGAAMNNINQLGFYDAIQNNVLRNEKPIFGICLGMQLMAEYSTENGRHQGLGLINGYVDSLELETNEVVPHVGWNDVQSNTTSRLFSGIKANTNYYFDHSYHLIADESIVSSRCSYGMEIVSSIEKANIFATQFHPEKSQLNGLRILNNFLKFVE